MRWFKNLKISVKLISTFVILALITGAMGVYGIMNMRSVDQDYTDMYIDYGVSLGDLGAVGIHFNWVEKALRDMLMTDNLESKQSIYQQIQQRGTIMAESMEKFGASIRQAATKQIYENLQGELASYKEIRDELIQLALENRNEQALLLLPKLDGYAASAEKLFNELFDVRRTNGSIQSDKLTDQTASTTVTMIVVIIGAMLAAILFGIYISRLISTPVRKLVDSAIQIADGDLNVKIDVNTKDEIGELAEAFRKMSDNLNEIMSNVQRAAEQVAAGSRQISISSISLSQGATEQASSIEQLTASIEEIASQTKQNADYSNEANLLAEAATKNAIHGNDQMKEMLKAMDEINQASANISKIIKVIDEIAFQTNILALNAAVEAARAGQHGKGFAVVAEEVRNLAARSANAAKETTEMIEGSIKKAEIGTSIAHETAQALQKIVDDVAKVANLINDIAAASNEQSLGINQINQGIMQVSQVVQENSSTSEESAAASEQLSSQAEFLKEQVGRFRLRHNTSSTQQSIEELNPELLRLFEQMAERKGASEQVASVVKLDAEAASGRIQLNDEDFGKY